MSAPSYAYQSILRDALKINWRVEDLIGGSKKLDFTKPFLPDSLTNIESIQCLSRQEKLVLNHIRGNSYLYFFVLVESFIIPMVCDRLRQRGYEDVNVTRALLHFVEEEGKHICLFKRFAKEFEAGFGTICECIGPAQKIAEQILSYSPLSVLLFTLHIEWATQSHYLESIRGDTEDLDPQFCNLLKHHWLEEAQHTRLDTLLLHELTAELSQPEIEAGFEDYLAVVNLLEQGLRAQVELDLASLSKTTGRAFTPTEQQEIQTAQEQSYRWAFLCTSMTHPSFVKILRKLSQPGQVRVLELAKTLS